MSKELAKELDTLERKYSLLPKNTSEEVKQKLGEEIEAKRSSIFNNNKSILQNQVNNLPETDSEIPNQNKLYTKPLITTQDLGIAKEEAVFNNARTKIGKRGGQRTKKRKTKSKRSKRRKTNRRK